MSGDLVIVTQGDVMSTVGSTNTTRIFNGRVSTLPDAAKTPHPAYSSMIIQQISNLLKQT